MKGKFEGAWEESQSSQLALVGARNGVYIEFISDPGAELVTKSLEDMKSKEVRLLNVRTEESDGGGLTTLATVYVSNKKKSYFINKLEKYISENTATGKPKNQDLIASISEVRSALLVDSFWTDTKESKPSTDKTWIEVWLRGDSDNDAKKFNGILSLSLIHI